MCRKREQVSRRILGDKEARGEIRPLPVSRLVIDRFSSVACSEFSQNGAVIFPRGLQADQLGSAMKYSSRIFQWIAAGLGSGSALMVRCFTH